MRFLALLIPAAVAAQPVEIPAEVVEQCKQEGCIIVMPEGMVLPKAMVKEAIQTDMQRAYEQGMREGMSTCKRKDA